VAKQGRTKKSGARRQASEGEVAGERLQKLLAAAGFGSRRGCEDFLRTGRVAVNGEVAGLGDRADPGRDIVTLDGEAIAAERLRYWLVHKPRGMLTTVRDPEGRPTIVALVPPGEVRLFPVGRLDGETSGLVLMTNDGAMTHRLLHPSLGCEREYRVRVKGELDLDKRARLEKGVWVEGGRTAPARVKACRFDPKKVQTLFRIILTEGRKRQIRRSLQSIGCPVLELVRVRMGPLELGKLPRGASRPLRAAEIRELREHVSQLRVKPRPRRVRA
jgi:23S rRNA pseudouridine2605 synthase